MSAADLSACSPTRPLLPSMPIETGRGTVAVFDEGDHLEVYLAPVGLGLLATALAGDLPVTAWDPLGRPLGPGLVSASSLPSAGEAIDGPARAAIPPSLRASPRSLLAAGHEWVLCAEDSVHAVVFARRPSVVVRAVHGVLTHLLGAAGCSTRVDPRVVGLLARPSRLGPHLLAIDPSHEFLTIQSPTTTRWLCPDRRGIWRPRP